MSSASVKARRKAQDAASTSSSARDSKPADTTASIEITTLALILSWLTLAGTRLRAGGIADGRGFLAAMHSAPKACRSDPIRRYGGVIVGSELQRGRRQLPRQAARCLFAKKIAPVRAIINPFVEARARGGAPLRSRAGAGGSLRPACLARGILEGDLEEGELEAGQSSGLIRDVVPALEVVLVCRGVRSGAREAGGG